MLLPHADKLKRWFITIMVLLIQFDACHHKLALLIQRSLSIHSYLFRYLWFLQESCVQIWKLVQHLYLNLDWKDSIWQEFKRRLAEMPQWLCKMFYKIDGAFMLRCCDNLERTMLIVVIVNDIYYQWFQPWIGDQKLSKEQDQRCWKWFWQQPQRGDGWFVTSMGIVKLVRIGHGSETAK